MDGNNYDQGGMLGFMEPLSERNRHPSVFSSQSLYLDSSPHLAIATRRPKAHPPRDPSLIVKDQANSIFNCFRIRKARKPIHLVSHLSSLSQIKPQHRQSPTRRLRASHRADRLPVSSAPISSRPGNMSRFCKSGDLSRKIPCNMSIVFQKLRNALGYKSSLGATWRRGHKLSDAPVQLGREPPVLSLSRLECVGQVRDDLGHHGVDDIKGEDTIHPVE